MRSVHPLVWTSLAVMLAGFALWALAPAELRPWILAGGLYALFLAHYQNWRGPVTGPEIERYMGSLASSPANVSTDIEIIRLFLEADDGREFFMGNLAEIPASDIPHPVTGKPVSPRKLIMEYFRPVTRALLVRAGHPAILMRRIGGNMDCWGPIAETGSPWQVTAIMRYRSRRDLIEMVLDPRFASIHPIKRAAISEAISYPNQLQVQVSAGPRLFLGMALALLAAFANIVILAAG